MGWRVSSLEIVQCDGEKSGLWLMHCIGLEFYLALLFA